ncbi:MAG TPA: hypothetical protein VF411_06210, partial [Bacteroidia bacterium]
MKKLLSTLLVASIGGASALYIQQKFFKQENFAAHQSINNAPPVRFTASSNGISSSVPDFTGAAEASVNAVVHVTTQMEEKYNQLSYDP